MVDRPKLLRPEDLTEDELREVVTKLRDVVYGSDFPEEGAAMMDGIYAVFEEHRLAHEGGCRAEAQWRRLPARSRTPGRR